MTEIQFADDIRAALDSGMSPAAIAQELIVPINDVLAVQASLRDTRNANRVTPVTPVTASAPQVRTTPADVPHRATSGVPNGTAGLPNRVPNGTPTVVRPVHTPSDEAKSRANSATELLIRADRIDNKRIQGALGKARKALVDLAALVNDYEDRAEERAAAAREREAARAEVERLQRQLQEARARLAGRKVGEKSGRNPGETSDRPRGGWVVGDGNFPCRHEGCDRVAPTPQGRAAHERHCTAAAVSA